MIRENLKVFRLFDCFSSALHFCAGGKLYSTAISVLACLVLLISLPAPGNCREVSDAFIQTPGVSEALNRIAAGDSWSGPVRVIVLLKTTPAKDSLGSEKSSRSQKMISWLKKEASSTQREFLHFSEMGKSRQDAGSGANPFMQFRKPGKKVQGSKGFWISNSVALTVSPEDLEIIANHPDVVEIVENKILFIPSHDFDTDEYVEPVKDLWNLRAIGLDKIGGMGLTGEGVRVGHLDTGINAEIPELSGRVALWAEFGPGGERVDSTPHDTHPKSHGTHTASVIAGETTGVAPGASLLSAMVLSGGYGTMEQVLAGMQWVIDPDGDPETDDGAQVVNMSWGMPGISKVLREAIKNMVSAGVLPVCAIGNSGINSTYCPGNVPEALGVGSVDEKGWDSIFSGGGEVCWEDVCLIKPDMTAPGDEIWGLNAEGEHQRLDGTSLAAPHVAGSAALLLEHSPDLTLNQLRGFLLNTTEDLGIDGPDDRYGRGELDMDSAFSYLDLYRPRFGALDIVMESVAPVGDSLVRKHHVIFSEGEGIMSGFETFQAYIGPDMKTLGLADVNGDGYSDFVTVEISKMDESLYLTNYYVYLSVDSRGFSAYPANWCSYTSDDPEVVEFIGLGDVNGDGRSDLVLNEKGVTQYGQNSNQVHALLSNGSNGFENSTGPWGTITKSSTYKVTFALGDVNGDLKSDLITEVRYSEQQASYSWRPVYYQVALSEGNGFSSGRTWLYIRPTPVSGPIEYFAMSDVDGDGFEDLVLRETGSGLNKGINVYVCRSDGKGQFYRNMVWAVLDRENGLNIGSVSDVNGDGMGDLIIGSSESDSRIKICLSDGRSWLSGSNIPLVDTLCLLPELEPGSDILFKGAGNIGLGNWK